MAKLSKKQKLIAEKVDPDKVYTLDEAVDVLNTVSNGKFEESLDVSINLGNGNKVTLLDGSCVTNEETYKSGNKNN